MTQDPTIIATYQKQQALIQEYIQTVQSKLEQQRPVDDDQIHWGHIGKLAHVLGKFREMMELIDL